MLTQHTPVMLDAVLHYLAPQPNRNYIDCTVGGGGHTEAILKLNGPQGKVLAIDWDNGAIAKVAERLKEFRSRLCLANDTYINLKEIVYGQKFEEVYGILLDLGLSSDQLQNSGRGFSFQVDEPLDMRFDPLTNKLTAAEIINTWTFEKIRQIFQEYGEEKSANRIAQAIVEERTKKEIATTGGLVSIVMRIKPRRGRIHPATQIFQALRIAVNDELNNVRKVLKTAAEILVPGGRLAVITFHSLEDRIVKQYFKQESQDCICPPELPVCKCDHHAQWEVLTPKPVLPSEAEIQENFRARSAKLRVVKKL